MRALVHEACTLMSLVLRLDEVSAEASALHEASGSEASSTTTPCCLLLSHTQRSPQVCLCVYLPSVKSLVHEGRR